MHVRSCPVLFHPEGVVRLCHLWYIAVCDEPHYRDVILDFAGKKKRPSITSTTLAFYVPLSLGNVTRECVPEQVLTRAYKTFLIQRPNNNTPISIDTERFILIRWDFMTWFRKGL
jgi:hypothetical protein